MQWIEAAGIWAVFSLQACAWPMESPQTAASTAVATVQLAGCELFPGAPIGGSGHSVALASGQPMLVFSGSPDGKRHDGSLIIPKHNVQYCSGPPENVMPAFANTASTDDFTTPMALVDASGEVFGFYESWRLDSSQPFGVRITGRGVGKYDRDTKSFAPLGLIWTADRPNYGFGAYYDGTRVYVYGCQNGASAFERNCFAARVLPKTIGDPSTYEYAIGVNQFSHNADATQPIAINVGDLSMTKLSDGRLIATFVRPLDSTVYVRAALGPTGPFSNAFALFRCDVGAGEYCAGGVVHTALVHAHAGIAVSYTRASFEKMPAGRGQPRLVDVVLPKELP